MTKFQIISQTGVKVCIIEAVSIWPNPNRVLMFLNKAVNLAPNKEDILFWLPAEWVAIPVDVMVNEYLICKDYDPKFCKEQCKLLNKSYDDRHAGNCVEGSGNVIWERVNND